MLKITMPLIVVVILAGCLCLSHLANAQCNPAAAEIPNNGTDEDCDGLDDLFLVLPPQVYGVVGQDMEIYFRNLILSKHPQDYQFSVQSQLLGIVTAEKWRFIPSQPGVFPWRVVVRAGNGQELASAQTLVCISPNSLPADSSPKRLLLFGHSFFDQGYLPKYIFDLLKQPGNPPVSFHGKKASWADSLARHEGYGGMMARWFFNDTASPIRYGNTIQFRRYFNETICTGCAPDWIVFHLDINDFCGYSALAGVTLQEIDDSITNDWNRHATRLIDSMRVAAPRAKIAICISPPPNARDTAFAITYGSNPVLNNRWRWQKIIHRLIFKNIERYAHREHQGIYLIPEYLDIDDFAEYNPLDARHPEPPDNNIHTHCGYNEIAKTIYAWLKWVQHQPPAVFAAYRDADADGFGNPQHVQIVTSLPVGFVLNSLDCDDADPLRHPQATERCNQLDDNCNHLIDDESVPPVAICHHTITVKTNANGLALVAPQQVDAGSYDNCHPITLSLNQNTFHCQQVGHSSVVTLTVHDAMGNQANCQSLVQVLDGTLPVAKCHAEKEIILSADGYTPIYYWDINQGSWDACTDIQYAVSRHQITCDDLPGTVVWLTVTDAYGNTASCQTQIRVKDVTPPVARCRHHVSVVLDENGQAAPPPSFFDDNSTDACTRDLLFDLHPPRFDCSMLGEHSVRLTVHDADGNTATCQTQVRVEDKYAPQLSLLATDTVEVPLTTDGTALFHFIPFFNYDDNCGVGAWHFSTDGQVVVTGNAIQFECGAHRVGQTFPVFIAVSDASGNFSAPNTLYVHLRDITPPQLTCRELNILLPAAGSITVPHDMLVDISTDACSPVQWLTPYDQHFNCEDVGQTYFFEQIATDAAQNVSKCNSIVHIRPALDTDGDGTDDCLDDCPLQPETTTFLTFYADFDGDGFGTDSAPPIQACEMIAHYVTSSGDCDDTNPNIHPHATEIWNDTDDNCNGEVDEGWLTTHSTPHSIHLSIYPNPSSGALWLEWQLPPDIFFEKIDLSDVTGRQAASLPIPKLSVGKQFIYLPKLPPGCYLLKILFQNGQQQVLRWLKI